MHILYATDGSKGAIAAARLLRELPLSTEGTLTILTVMAGDCQDADAVLATAVQTLGPDMVSVERRTRQGHPAAEIVRAAEEAPTDLIVLGAHGNSGIARFLLGSVAERVARHAPCPVLLVREPGNGFHRVVLGVDSSDGSAQAAGWLRQFPLLPDCDVHLVTVLPNLDEIAREYMIASPPLTKRNIPLDEWQREQASARLAETAASFGAAGMSAVTEIRSGNPAPGLLAVAADAGADLIVVGSRGLSALERFLMGSVSQQVLYYAHCSVLVVRGPADASEGADHL